MILLSTPSSSSVFATPEAGNDYFATEAHYLSLAGRLVAALRRGSRFVLVLGNPPANPILISRAVSTAAAWWYTVIDIRCGPDLSRDQLPHLPPRHAALARGGREAAETVDPTPSLSPLFIFEDADTLSDEQIEQVYQSLTYNNGITPAGVLIARPAFLDRLERAKPHFIKEGPTACFRLNELGREEIETFIRRQRNRGEQVSAFTPEAITAIADISAGDPTLVNHLSRLTLKFAGLAGIQNEDNQVGSLVEATAPDDIFGKRLPPADAAPKPLRHRWRVQGLQIGLLVCLAVGGILAVPDVAVSSLMHRAGQRLAALCAVDFGAWIKAGHDTAPRAMAEVTAAVVKAEPATSQRAETGSMAAIPDHPMEQTAEMLTTQAAALAQAIPPNEPETTIQSASLVHAEPAGVPLAAGPATTTQLPASPPMPLDPATRLVGTRLTNQEIAALVARGDALVGTGDITSARLFYGRAAEAGDGRAALRMGATFDPGFLERVGVRGVAGNQQEALSWYRRARNLGQAEAARGLTNSQPQ